ncbi:MAG: 1-deoxy-D-xylulose-5-phosphate reductoisomerase [Chloroflexota bacterium]
MANRPRRVAILGSTGSIGCQALDVIRDFPERFQVVALGAGSDSEALRAQVAEFSPSLIAVTRLRDLDWSPAGHVLAGPSGLNDVAADADADIVLVATVGSVGLNPTLTALRRGLPVIVANKEALVMAGELVMGAAREGGTSVVPVDSEHNAVWQCLMGEDPAAIDRVTLTASGGAFRDWPVESLPHVTPVDALKHPTWVMGPKITVDSATLMNKGLEVLEASWLFNLPLNKIDFVMHRESIVHCLVTLVDGSVKAQLAVPDMHIPIQYALSYPERLPSRAEPLDLIKLGKLSFEPVDRVRFRCAFLALEAGARGGTYPAVLCGANEVAVYQFLDGRVGFTEIADLVEAALNEHRPTSSPDVESVWAADKWARAHVLASRSDTR